MAELYRDFFDIDPEFFPAVNASVIEQHPNLWEKFYPHETFVKLMRDLISCVGRLQKLSVWVEGEYGTGKSHPVLTLKKLLEADDATTKAYFDRFPDQLGNDLYNKLYSLKHAGNILVAHRYASSDITNETDLLFDVQDSIVAALREKGYKEGDGALRSAAIQWLSDTDNKAYFNGLMKGSYAATFAGDDVDALIKKLRTFEGLPLSETMAKVMKLANERGIRVLTLTKEVLQDWIRAVIKDNNLYGLIFIWDEFTDFFRNNRTRLSGLQALVEMSEADFFYLIPVTHNVANLFPAKDKDWNVISHRFILPFCNIELPDNMAFVLMGKALEKRQDTHLMDEWQETSEELYERTRDARALVKKQAKIQDTELRDVLPLHPYAALLLKNMASYYAGDVRSMFDFLKNETGDEIRGFKWFIDTFGPADDNPLLTVDLLWDFFYEKGKELLDGDVRRVLDSFGRARNLIGDEPRILKAILLMQAIYEKTGSQVETLAPSAKNIEYAFMGSDLDDGQPTKIANNLVRKKISNSQKVTRGIDRIGLLVETVNADTLIIRTKKSVRDYPNSMLHIEELVDAYAALCDIDPTTARLDKALGKAEQWAFALNEITSNGSWNSLVTHLFGSTYSLELTVGQWDRFPDDMQWLYFIALKLFGSQKNWCLNHAAGAASSPKDMVRKIYRSILGENRHSSTFIKRYQERKQLLQQMFDVEDDTEVIDYIQMTKQHKKDAVRYLTNNTKLEKEAIIDLISVYADEYTPQELKDILMEVYPDLAAYLEAYSFPGNTWLDAYFTEYRYSKVLNRISPELREMAQQQAVDHDFLKLLPRIAVVDSIPKDGTFLFFVDAMGVEFIPYIVQKCRKYDLKLTVTVSHCELPSLTRCNKDFFESYPPEQRTKVSELDDIIHHGKENYDYQVTKTPLHLIRELEIIDEVLRNARTRLLSGNSTRVLLVADHGATRMAVINEHIIDIDVNSKGTNGGRVCEYTEAVKSVPCAIPEGSYYILASYDRFKGGQPANVEAHGGGTLEEVVVPVITLSMPTEEIEVQVEPKIIEYSFKQQPVLKLFSKTILTNVSVLINGKWYKADTSVDGQNFLFTLAGLKKGQYTATLYANGNEVATELAFELRSKAGSSTGKTGGIL